MSTVAVNNDPLARVSGPKVSPKPKKALTGKIVKISDPKQSDSDYDIVDIIFEPTRGSAKLFPGFMFRPEMVSFGAFDLDRDYVDNKSGIAHLEEAKLGRDGQPTGKQIKDSYVSVYGMNIMPNIVRDKKTGEIKRVTKLTPLFAITGGTVEGFRAFIALAMERLEALPDAQVGPFGYKQFTAQQFVDLLNEFIKSHPQTEQLVVAKQRKDMSGDLTENYEVGEWLGAFNEESYNAIEKRIADLANDPDVGKRIQRGYQKP